MGGEGASQDEEKTFSSSLSSSNLRSLVKRNAQLEKKMSEIFKILSAKRRTRKRTDDDKDEDDKDEFMLLEFLERQQREQEEQRISFSSTSSSSSSLLSSKEEEENVLVVLSVFVESAMRLVNLQLRFLKFLMKEDQEEEQVQCHRRRRIRTREMTLIAHAVGSVVLSVGRVLSSTNANISSVLIQTQTTTMIKTNSNRGEEEDEDIVVVADIESVSVSLAKEVLTDAVETLKKHGGEEESSTDESDDDGKILEEKQWYAACVVRAIKACATLTSWPEREMDALVNVLLRECAFHNYEGARRGEVDDGNGETKVSEDAYIGGFTEESDWCLPPSSAFEKAGKAKTTITEVSPVELLKTEALAALGYMAKRNPSGMCSRWQIVFPREFSPAPKKKKSSVLLASQKTLEKLMVFERSASVRSAACFAIISLLDSSEAKKYLAMAEMKDDKGVSGGSAVSAMSSSSSRRASSGFSTVSMNLGENAVALCETISYAWTRISEHHTRKRFPGAPTPSKDNIGSADKWISWLSILTEKAVDSLPFLRLPKRLVPQLANSIKCALLIDYSSFPSSAVVSAFFKEAPIIRCLGITLSAKIGFESLESNAFSSAVFKSSLNARKYTADEMTLFLQACEALWKKAAASTTRDSLIDKEVQESCEAFKALQKLASSENASKILFPNRECVCKLSPDVLMAIFVAKSSSRANKVAFEKVMHASVKLQCAMLAAVLQKSRRKNSSFLFCAEIRRELWFNFIDNALPSCLSNARSDEVTQLVKIAALRCLSETTDCVISDIRSSSNGTAELSRIKAVFEAPLDILREKHRRYPSATRAEAMRTLASLLILDPKYFEMNEVLLGALESVKNAMNQERTHQDFSKTLEMNASLCAANIALCATRLPTPPPTPSADDSDDVSINKELTHLFHEWTISKGDKVRANVARGLGHIAKFRDLEDETLQLICEALFSCASTGSAKTQWNSCVAIKNLFENQEAISNEAFSAIRGISNAGAILTRLLLTLIKTSENFKIRRESLAAISRASRTFLDHLSYVDCIRVVVEALVQSEKQCSKLVGEFEDDDGNVTSKRAAEKYREELKAQAISTFVHLLSIGVVSERGCSRIVREHSSHVLEAIRITVNNVETGGSEGDGDRFESATKFDKEMVSKAQTVLSEMLGVPVTVPRPAVFEKVLLAKNENVLSSKHMHK